MSMFGRVDSRGKTFRRSYLAVLSLLAQASMLMGPASCAKLQPIGDLSAGSITTFEFTTGQALNDAMVGQFYSQSFGINGGTSPYTYSLKSGTLPTGLALTTQGTISGIVGGAAGSFSFAIEATDSIATSISQSFTLKVAPPFMITAMSVPAGTANVNYFGVITASGGSSPYTFTSSGLPAGLILDSATGVISGSTNAVAVFSVVFTCTDLIGLRSVSTLPLVISGTAASTPTFVNTSLPSATKGTSYAIPLVVSGGIAPYTFSIVSGSLPGGLTLSSTLGTISGTPTASGTFNISARVTDFSNNLATQAYTIVVSPAFLITTTTLPTATASVSYVRVITASGGATPYAFSSTGLPTGLSLDSNSGLISGTTTSLGTYPVSVTVTDSGALTYTANYTLVVSSSGSASPSIVTSTLASATVGTPYSAALVSTGGLAPYAYSVTAGALPSGISLNTTQGTLSGTPTSSGSFSFTIDIADANSSTGTKALSMTVAAAAAPTIPTTSLASGKVGSAYAQQVLASGGISPYSFSITSGTLPAGLTLTASTGAISGTPTTAGSSTVTVQVSDANSSVASKSLSISIAASGISALSFVNTTLLAGPKGSAYSEAAIATGGVPPYTFTISAGTLPTGLSISSTSGYITGTPSTSATSSFTVHVADSLSSTATQVYSLKINDPLLVSTSSLAVVLTNVAYSATISVTGGSGTYANFSATGLPTGLSINATTGVISGVVTATSTQTVGITVTDSDGLSNSRNFTLSARDALTISTTTLAGATASTAYNETVTVTGGQTPYTFQLSAGALPAGLFLSSSSGTIKVTGTPTTAGTANFTVQVTDALNSSTTRALSIVVANEASPTVSTSSLINAQADVPYTQQIVAAGGKLPYAYDITLGALPTGVSLNATTGALSGTPTTSGTATFTVRVTDANSNTGTAALSIVVAASPYATLVVQTTSILPIIINQTNTRTISGTGGLPPYTFALSSGSLPTGMTLSASTGVISGTPSVTGTSNFTMLLTDNRASTASRALTLKVENPLYFSTSSLAVARQNIGYTQGITVTGGSGTYSFTQSGLPSGFSISSAGVIAGVSATNSTQTITVTVVDSDGQTASQDYTFKIISAPSILTTTLPYIAVATSFSQTISVSGGLTPYTFALTSGTLPAGLALSASAGTITGTPTTGANVRTGAFPITVQVTDAASQTATQSYTANIAIKPTAQDDISNPLRSGTSGVPYSDVVKSFGGTGALSWSATGLPTGLSLNATSGRISGTPSDSDGNYTVAITITDTNSLSTTRNKTIRITSAKTAKFDNGTLIPIISNKSSVADPWILDMNADGIPDMVTINTAGSNELLVWIGVGDGTFTVNSPYGHALAAAPNYLKNMAFADMDSDGKMDIVVAEGNNYQIIKGDNNWTSGYTQTVATVTNTSVTMTAINLPTGITVGQTVSGANIPANTTVTAISGITLTMSAAATPATSTGTYTFQGTTGNISNGSNQLTTLASTVGITVGDTVTAVTAGIPAGTTVTAIAGTTVTMSANATATVTAIPVIFNPTKQTLAFTGYNTSMQFAVGDINGDGKPDIVGTDWNGATTRSFLNCGTIATVSYNGNGVQACSQTGLTPLNWHVAATYGITQPTGMALVDWNGDGKLDMLATSQSNRSVYVFLGNGNGTFAAAVGQGGFYNTPTYIRVADLNGDARPDVVIEGAPDALYIVINNGAGGFGATSTASLYDLTPTGVGNPQARLADVNADGYPDLISVQNISGINTTHVFFNDGTGQMINRRILADNYLSYGIALGNLHVGPKTTGTITSGSPSLSSLVSTTDIAVGQKISGTGIPSGTTVLSISGSTVTMSANATSSTTGVTVIFYANPTTTGNITNASNQLVSLGSTTGIAVGQSIAGTGIQFGTTVLGLSGSTVTMSSNATATTTGVSVTFTGTAGSNIRPTLVSASGSSASWSPRLHIRKNNNLATAFDSGTTYTTNSPILTSAVMSTPAIGDLNGDGYPDSVLKLAAFASIYLGDSSGNMAIQSKLITTHETAAIAAATAFGKQTLLGDFNGDGNLDYVTGNYNANVWGGVFLALGNGDGTFGTETYFTTDLSGCTTSDGVRSVGAADFNRDGKLDLVIGFACNASPRIAVYNGYGDGTFNSGNPYVIIPTVGGGSYVDMVYPFDINADGKMDIVAVTSGAGLILFQGSGTGTFTQGNYINPSLYGGTTTNLEIADMNNDGLFDYVLSGTTANNLWTQVLGGANMTFGTASNFTGLPIANIPAGYFVKVADMDSDGKLDVLWTRSAGSNGNGLQFFKGAGDGTYTQPLTTPVNLACGGQSLYWQLSIADFNGDGLPDIACGAQDGGTGAYFSIDFNLAY